MPYGLLGLGYGSATILDTNSFTCWWDQDFFGFLAMAARGNALVQRAFYGHVRSALDLDRQRFSLGMLTLQSSQRCHVPLPGRDLPHLQPRPHPQRYLLPSAAAFAHIGSSAMP